MLISADHWEKAVERIAEAEWWIAKQLERPGLRNIDDIVADETGSITAPS
jgi:myo-inositol catabolism protein IolC